MQFESTNTELLRRVKSIRRNGGFPTKDDIQAAALLTADNAGQEVFDHPCDGKNYWPYVLYGFWYRFRLFRESASNVMIAAQGITELQSRRLDSATGVHCWCDRLAVECQRISRWCRNAMGETEFIGGIQQLLAAADSERPESTLRQYKFFRDCDDELTAAFAIDSKRVETSQGQEPANYDARVGYPLREIESEKHDIGLGGNRIAKKLSYLGLEFGSEYTISRNGEGYHHVPPIPLAPQQYRLLKFIHEAQQFGRTQDEILEAFGGISRGSIGTEKNRVKVKLAPIDIDLGPSGKYIVRCTRNLKNER